MDTKTKTLKSTHSTPQTTEPSPTAFFHKESDGQSESPFFDLGIQAKLTIGRKGDRYEKEADSVADTVVSGDGASRGLPQISRISGRLQRSESEEEEPLQMQADQEEEEQPLQMQEDQEEEEQPLQMQEDQEEEEQPLQMQEDQEEEEQPLQMQADQEVEEQPLQMQEDQEEEEQPLQMQADQEVEEQPLQMQEDQEEEEQPLQMQADAEEDEPLQMQADQEEEEQPLQMQADAEEETVQARSAGEVKAVPESGIERQLKRARGEGSPLAEDVRMRMEAQLGADFSGIRIHTDDLSMQMTRLLRAKAFTQGRDIYFGRDQYSPHTREGTHLLAHELTHTVQQGAVRQSETEMPIAPARIQRQEGEGETYMIRPELLDAIRIARTQIGKINAQDTNSDGTRIGWERLYDIFLTSFGGEEVIHKDVIKYYKTYKGKDALPSWCGIFVWWALKTAGIPIPDWQLGKSIAADVVPRKPGELPKKGDIAYMGPDFFDHFAIVSGVEDPKTAEGKDFRSIKVATVNGNTMGDDKLGGQVEEKWHPIGAWLSFFDPLAKLDMPPAELVETGVTPDEASADEQAEAETAKTEKPEEETPPTDVEHLEDEIATPPIPPPEGASEVSVDLPPKPAPPAKEKTAEVEAVDLKGPSDESMVAFTEAAPSQVAKTQPDLGEALTEKVKEEKQTEAENAPVLTAQTSGKVEEGLTPPDQIPVPADAQLGDGVKGAEPTDLKPDPHTYDDPTPSNKGNEELLDKKEESGFLAWFKNNIKSFMNRIRTKDPTLDTSAGKRPNVKLEGEADPERMKTQRTEATGQLTAQRDTVTEKLKHHPGQQNIQPKKVKEDRKANLSEEPPEPIETQPDSGAKDYVEAPLSASVRKRADSLLQPDLDAHMSEAKGKTKSAAQTRETDKKAEITKAESKVEQENRKADEEQRGIVVTNRQKVAAQQKKGIEDAYGKVNEFNKEADTKQQTARKEIGEKVKTSEKGAREELKKGETEAERIKKEGEKKAANEKAKLEKEQKKESWWDKAANLVKKAVKAVTKAIDAAFNWMREQVAKAINAAKELAVGIINAARDWIKKALNTFRDWAKGMVDKYLKEHFPGLAAAINKGIDAVVDTAIKGVDLVADAAIKTVEALADALGKALDKILSAYQTALKAAVQIAGAVVTGDFAEALRIAIQAGCDIAGIDSKPIFDFIDRAKKAVMDILKNPSGFFNNLVKAVGGGIRNFVKNIKQHLMKGLVGWLTGAISEAGISLPEKFDLKGIFSLVMQILGLTYENIKAKLIKRYPPAEKVINFIEKGFAIVKRLVTEGPMALWEMVKEKLSNLKEMVIGGIRDWVITTVIKEGVVWLLSLLNPAGALVKVLKLLYDFVMFLVERFQQIKEFVLSVYNSVVSIAAGVLGKAMAAVEDALSRSVPVVISMLASLIGLGGIGKTVKKIIGKVRKPIDKLIDALITKVIKFAKKLLKKGKALLGKAKEGVLKLIKWWRKKKTFTDKTGSGHKIYFKGSSKSAKLYVASVDPMQMEAFFKAKRKEADEDNEANFTKSQVSAAENYYDANVKPVEKKLRKVDETYKGGAGGSKLSTEKKKKGVNENKKLVHDLEKVLAELSNQHLKGLFGSSADDFPPPKLPVMADNKKAGGFTADYIVKGEKYEVKTGTVSGKHVGNLEGWPALQGAKLTHGAKWVRMHLLPHKLGGNAVDSNLTPASGPKSNIPFSSAVEQPAIKAAVEGPVKQNKPIWYRFRINYHSGKAKPFPKYLKGEWGHYDTSDGEPKRGPVVKSYDQQPAPPSFEPIIPNLNAGDVTAGQVAAATGVDRGFVKLMLKVRAENGGSLGITGNSVRSRMEAKYVETDAQGNRTYRFGVKNFDARLSIVLAAIPKKVVLS